MARKYKELRGRDRKRLGLLALCLVLVAFGIVFVASSSANLPGSSFEGNDGNLVVNGGAGAHDWANQPGVLKGIDTPSGSADNAFGQGTSEDNPAVTIVDGSIPPSKNDLTRFYAASDFLGLNGNFLYLAWERTNTNGDANLDFELNQHATSGFDASTTGPVTLNRTAGDVLITYDFSGSGTPTIGVLHWLTAAAGDTVAECFKANSLPCWGNQAGVQPPASEAMVNSTTITDPLNNNASLVANQFGEASINLTAANVFPPDSCEQFGSVWVKSRSSSSFSAEVKDFIAPNPIKVSNCASPTVATTLSAESVVPGTNVHDSATLSGATSDAGGTVTYSVYSDNQCTQNKQDAGTKTVTNGVVPDSNGIQFNAEGTYYWQAVYSGDHHNNGASSPCQSEILHVAKVGPTIATTLSATSASIGDTVHDSSALSGATADAGGSVTYTVYTDDQCSAGARDAGTKTVNNGAVPDSNGLQFANAGTYYWQAAYSGDSKNNAAKSPCQSEILTIAKAKPTIATTLSAETGAIGATVHDSSTLSGASANAGGSVTYTVYTNDTCSAGSQDAGTKTVNNGSVPDSNGIQFNNAGTYYWQASYSGDSNNEAAVSPCKSEILTISKNQPSVATTLSAETGTVGDTVHDSSTISGATATAGGSVTYTVYTDNLCSMGAQTAGTKTVTNGVVPNSDGVQFNSPGTYYWRASYSGDANNAAAASPCQSEILTIAKAKPSVATTLSAETGTVGDTVHDSATLSSASSDAGGTVTYTVYTDNKCTLGAQDAGTKTVTNGSVPDSNGIQFNNAGTYYWQAAYSGDANNAAAASPCQSEILTIAKAKPSVSTTLSADTGSVGDTVHDSAALSGASANAGGTVTYTVYTDDQCSAGAKDAGTKTVTNGGVPDSNGIQFNNAGTYYWQAAYSGDSNNEAGVSPCKSEILTIAKVKPSIATTLSADAGTVGDTVHDTSLLSGATATAGGSVTYTVYTDDQCTAGAQDAGTKTVTNGVVPNSNSIKFDNAGTYYWQASYSGDVNNEAAVSPCKSEILTIAKAAPTIATTLSADSGTVGDTVHDSSTLSGATATAGGSVTYTVYSDNECSLDARDAGTKTVTNGAVPNSDGLTFNSPGTYYWQASYSGDGNNKAAKSPCQSEILTIAKAKPSIATTLSADSGTVGDTVHDSSTLTGASSDAGGSVTYTVYTDDQCTLGAVDAGTKSVTNGAVPNSNGIKFDNAGTYYWQASYSGDANNNAAVSPCKSEILTIAKAAPTIATTLSDEAGPVGATVHDSSTLTGASSDAGGTVTYTVYTDDQCSVGAKDAGTKTVLNGVVPDSDGVKFSAAGTFYWQASYSGDSNNKAAKSPCQSEILSIGKNTPTIATVLSSDSSSIGDKVHDTATLSGGTDDAAGTAQYSVYTDSECSKLAVAGTDIDKQPAAAAVSGGLVADSAGVTFLHAGDFYWRVVYSGDANNAGATSACDEHLVIGKNHPTITTQLSSSEILAGSSIHDSATLHGATADAGGTVTYTVFGSSQCTEGTKVGDAVSVDAGSVPNSDGMAFPNAGTYYWQASYSGDDNNAAATSACTEEVLQVDSPSISITKNPKSQSITAGGTANFTITVKNTGTVTLHDVTVTDLLAPACAKAKGTLGPLAPGQSTSYDCSLSAVSASFTNSATAIGTPPVGPDVTATDTAPVTVNAVPPPPQTPVTPPPPKIDLAITKVGTPNPTTLGGDITWTLTVVNNGPNNATGVTVADAIPAGTSYVSSTSTQGSCTGGALLNCQIGNMAVGQTVTVTLVTKSTATGNIPNTATVVGNEAETNTANNTASAQVTVVGPFKPPVVKPVCTALFVAPKQLTVGKKHALNIKVTQRGKGVAGVRVRIKGSTITGLTKPSNAKGQIQHAVKPMKAGIVTFTPVATKQCNNPRIGVIGVFTPPVTG